MPGARGAVGHHSRQSEILSLDSGGRYLSLKKSLRSALLKCVLLVIWPRQLRLRGSRTYRSLKSDLRERPQDARRLGRCPRARRPCRNLTSASNSRRTCTTPSRSSAARTRPCRARARAQGRTARVAAQDASQRATLETTTNRSACTREDAGDVKTDSAGSRGRMGKESLSPYPQHSRDSSSRKRT